MLPAASVAVAVRNLPASGPVASIPEKPAVPMPPRVMTVSPRNCCPSPNPDGSAAALAKNWSV